MARSRIRYGPGDWFLVPLGDGRAAPGRVVLRPSGHATLSYVFAPVDGAPGLEDVQGLDPGDALLAVYLSGLSIGSTWPLLGGSDGFDPAAWPLPEFESAVRSRPGRLRVDVRDERLEVVRQYEVPAEEAGSRQPGGVLGAEYLVQWLPLQMERGTLRPVRSQSWWRAGTHGSVPAAAGCGTAPERSLLRLVVPGPGGGRDAERLETRLRRGLHGVAEVDGTMAGPDGGEVWVYADDVTDALDAIRRVLGWRTVPDGAHVLVRSGDGELVRTDLR